MGRLCAFRDDDRGATLVETSIVFSLLLILTFGIVEFGYAFWQYHAIEKATSAGARYLATCRTDATVAGACTPIMTWQGNCLVSETTATATDPATGVSRPAQPGDPCSIVTGSSTWGPNPCPGTAGCNATDLGLLLTVMRQYYPSLAAANVQVQVSGSGLGFIGRGAAPNYKPVPLITVRTTGLTYDFIALGALLGLGSITLPSFATTLPAEDQKEGPGI